jgi:UDP-N-acetylglucosamine 2-epimerase (non-hydrolysing)
VKTILIVYGTRPEAIKLAPVIVELKKFENLRTLVICSGQHKEMLEGILELWNLAPDITLDYDFDSGRSSAIPGLMIELEKEFLANRPDFVIVQGDTATAAAAAIQAHALHIPVGHVEAGLRSNDLWNPWPEEANRRIIDAVSSLHFAPTQISLDNLEQEKYEKTSVLTGNTIVDALQHATSLLNNDPSIRSNLEVLLNFSLQEPFILFTQHRREGFGDGQEQVFDAIIRLSELGFKIVFPVHLNPSVRTKVAEKLGGVTGVNLIEPQGYLEFLELTRNSKLIISDSGGLQEEAPSFNKFILITRIRTERPEVVEAGFGHLVGYETKTILSKALEVLKNEQADMVNPFGDGFAASRIAKTVQGYLSNSLEIL